MSITDVTRSTPLGSVSAFRFVSLFESAVDAVAAWRNARATANALDDLTDRQLADIGLHRGDIAEVAETLAQR
jgi:uncharacterized protein YjiS (DUF1127 family)